MSDFVDALEAELLAAARRRAAAPAGRRRGLPRSSSPRSPPAALAVFALVPRGTTSAPSGARPAPPCSAQESLAAARARCTSNPFSSLSQ